MASVGIRDVRKAFGATQVIHGVADPLVPVASGHDLARRIPGALGDFIEGMGHDLPPQLLDRIAQGIARNARRAS